MTEKNKVEFITKIRIWTEHKRGKEIKRYLVVIPSEVVEGYKLNEWANKPVKITIEFLQ